MLKRRISPCQSWCSPVRCAWQRTVFTRQMLDRLFADLERDLVMYVGSYIIKREVWLTRERQRYYGTLFIHVATIFQKALPRKSLVMPSR